MTRLRQVLVNLRSNAVEFAVDDTGIDIAADQIERIFEPFVQVRAEAISARRASGAAGQHRHGVAAAGSRRVPSRVPFLGTASSDRAVALGREPDARTAQPRSLPCIGCQPHQSSRMPAYSQIGHDPAFIERLSRVVGRLTDPTAEVGARAPARPPEFDALVREGDAIVRAAAPSAAR